MQIIIDYYHRLDLDFFCIDLTAKENVERGSSLLFVLSISSTARDLAARAFFNSGLSSLSALGFLQKISLANSSISIHKGLKSSAAYDDN